MQTLDYDYLLPEDNDPGSIFWPALSTDIQKLAVHKHDGVTGALIGPTKLSLTPSWVLVSPGLYSLVVSIPTGCTYNDCVIQIRDGTTPFEVLYLTTDFSIATSTVFTIFSCIQHTKLEVVFK